MKIRYEIVIDDLVAFNRHNLPNVQRGLAIVLYVPTCICLMLGILIAADEQDPVYLAGGVALGLMWVGLFWLFTRWYRRTTVRRLMGSDSTRNMLCLHELELSDSALVDRTHHGSHTTAVREVEKIASTDSHTFIYVRSGGAYVIPRGASQKANSKASLMPSTGRGNRREWTLSRPQAAATWRRRRYAGPVANPCRGEK